MKKIYKIHDHLYVGLSGLATDQTTLAQRPKFRHQPVQAENRDMRPETFANVVSNMLYEKIRSTTPSPSSPAWTRTAPSSRAWISSARWPPPITSWVW